jgi:hypothetical protein
VLLGSIGRSLDCGGTAECMVGCTAASWITDGVLACAWRLPCVVGQERAARLKFGSGAGLGLGQGQDHACF